MAPDSDSTPPASSNLPRVGDLLWVPDVIAIENGSREKVRPYLVLNQPEPEGQRFLVIGTSKIGRTAHSRSLNIEPKDCLALSKPTAFLVDNVYQFAEPEIRTHISRGTCFVRGALDQSIVQQALAMVKDSKIVEICIKKSLGLR